MYFKDRLTHFRVKHGNLGGFLQNKYRKILRKLRGYLLRTIQLDKYSQPPKKGISRYVYFDAMFAISRRVTVVSFKDLARQLHIIWPASESQNTPPAQDIAIKDQTIYPAISAYAVKNAVFCPTNTAIANRSRLALPDLYQLDQTTRSSDPNFVLAHDQKQATIARAQIRSAPAGIFLGGAGAENWYHWMIEILPTALHVRDVPWIKPDLPFLVPQSCLNRSSFHQTLTALAKGRPIVGLDSQLIYKSPELTVLDPMVRGPLHLISGEFPRLDHYAQNIEAIQAYRAHLIDALDLTVRQPFRRIFIARRGKVRSYNQDSLLEHAQMQGIEILYPEELTFQEQAQAYLDASHIIGPTGAGFANLIFCQQGSVGLSWIIEQYREFCVYSNLATAIGFDLDYILVPTDFPCHSSYDAHSAAYTVDPDIFAAKLSAIL